MAALQLPALFLSYPDQQDLHHEPLGDLQGVPAGSPHPTFSITVDN